MKIRSPLMGLLLLATIILLPAARAQPVVETADEQTSLDEYQEIIRSLERVYAQSEQLQRQLDNKVLSQQQATENADNLRRSEVEILPLLNDMLESLEGWVDMDVPIMLDERRQRLKNLRTVVESPQLKIAEKFRRVLSAYQIESDYGREMGFYSGWLEIDGTRRKVSFLHIGRIVLAYQTADRSTTGFFNPRTRQWEELPDRYRSVVAEGLRIAARQAAPKMLRMPVAAPAHVQ